MIVGTGLYEYAPGPGLLISYSDRDGDLGAMDEAVDEGDGAGGVREDLGLPRAYSTKAA